ncbi:MAG: sulfotransferase [Acidimicrobiia bacterium]|nr:sulfotransferase [Acidimicrobiia bacterium]
MTLPNFVVVGAQKAGTTSLYRYLRAHPQVFMPATKELNFFVENFAWRRGLEWYTSHFRNAGDAVAIGEASPTYSMYPLLPGVAERMAATVPDARLIYTLREPVDRMRSGYIDALSVGSESRPIKEALLLDSRYLIPSSYALQIEHFLAHFDRSQLLVVLAEDLRQRRPETLAKIFEFLGVDPTWRPDDLHVEHHASAGRRKFRPTARLVGGTVVRAQLRLRPGLWEERSLPPRVHRRISVPITDEEVALDAETRAQLVDMLRNDLRRLPAYLDPGFDAWGLL